MINATRMSGLFLVCVMLSACDGTSSDPGMGNLTSGDQAQGVLMRLWSASSPGEADTTIQPLRFPVDLSPHPEAAAESFQLKAIVTRQDGSLFSIQAQLDRLALSIETEVTSAWSFSDIMRSGVAVGTTGQTALTTRDTVERRALGLADSDSNSLYVVDTHLTLQVPSDRQTASTSSDACKVRYHFGTTLPSPEDSEPESVSLEIAMPVCPQAFSLRGLNRWQASALATTAMIKTTGTVPATGDSTIWQGHAWLSQTWGNVPPTGGAVLIDQMSLRLITKKDAGVQVMSATRSKRKTGRGPQTVQAMMSNKLGDEQALELQWIDEGVQVSPMSGITYPQRFRMRSQDESIDLLLTPLVALPELTGPLGNRWQGAVVVSGTHSGVGFVDFQPMPDRPGLNE